MHDVAGAHQVLERFDDWKTRSARRFVEVTAAEPASFAHHRLPAFPRLHERLLVRGHHADAERERFDVQLFLALGCGAIDDDWKRESRERRQQGLGPRAVRDEPALREFWSDTLSVEHRGTRISQADESNSNAMFLRQLRSVRRELLEQLPADGAVSQEKNVHFGLREVERCVHGAHGLRGVGCIDDAGDRSLVCALRDGAHLDAHCPERVKEAARDIGFLAHAFGHQRHQRHGPTRRSDDDIFTIEPLQHLERSVCISNRNDERRRDTQAGLIRQPYGDASFVERQQCSR